MSTPEGKRSLVSSLPSYGLELACDTNLVDMVHRRADVLHSAACVTKSGDTHIVLDQLAIQVRITGESSQKLGKLDIRSADQLRQAAESAIMSSAKLTGFDTQNAYDYDVAFVGCGDMATTCLFDPKFDSMVMSAHHLEQSGTLETRFESREITRREQQVVLLGGIAAYVAQLEKIVYA